MDFRFSWHGSIVLCEPVSEQAKQFVEEQCQVEDWQWMGHRFGVDLRAAVPLMEALVSNGFEVEQEA